MSESVEWTAQVKVLLDQLVAAGNLSSDEWIEAFRATPRHVFAPKFYLLGTEGYREIVADEPDQRDEWLSTVYSDDSLIVQVQPHPAGYRLPSGETLRIPTSSSTMPSLMARMLEALDVRDGQRVLEIGTGTGYNAALLSHRLGASHVVSVDIDPGLVELARQRLAGLGYRPTLIAADGMAGVPEHGPYDRIIATAAVPYVPPAWIDQLTPNGKILVNVRGELAGGTLCLLTKHDDDEVIGPFLPIGGHFIWTRAESDGPHQPDMRAAQVEPSGSSRTTTRLDPTSVIDDDGFRFLLQLQLRGAVTFCHSPVHEPTRGERHGVVITAMDGSRAEVHLEPEPDGSRRVSQTGPRRLWDTVEATAHLWDELDHPRPDQFGILADHVTQFVWFGNDDGGYRWDLPLL